jgi:acetyl esterase
MRNSHVLFAALLLIFPVSAQSPKDRPKLTSAAVVSKDFVYKTTPEGELKLHGFFPTDAKDGDKRPVIVFFFGGGWKNGSFTQFIPQAEYFASRGIVALSADYRIASVHKTTPDACVEDGKSAIRWVRAHAGRLGINPDQVIAAGGSAGGHVAACTAFIRQFTCITDPKIEAEPNALVLFNPALNVSTNKIVDAKGNNIAESISPTLHLGKKIPPTWLVYGSADNALKQGQEYAKKAREFGADVELLVAPEQPHGFFNRSPWTESTTASADRFLTRLGYLKGEPALKPAADTVLKKE